MEDVVVSVGRSLIPELILRNVGHVASVASEAVVRYQMSGGNRDLK